MRRLRSTFRLEYYLAPILLLVIAPNTLPSNFIVEVIKLLGFSLYVPSSRIIPTIDRLLEYTLIAGTISLLFSCILIVSDANKLSQKPSPFAISVVIFNLIYLFDFCRFISSGDIYKYNELSSYFAAFFTFIVFYAACIFPDQQKSSPVVGISLALICLEGFYGIFRYASGSETFLSPGFGYRASGTFQNPNSFYPLFLIALPVFACRFATLDSRWKRFLNLGGYTICLLSLILTFMRGGWLGAAASLYFLMRSSVMPFRKNRFARIIGAFFIIGLLIGTVFLRTQGGIIGGKNDRSFWGRYAIWKVCIGVYLENPWLGAGVGTYSEHQYAHIPEELKQFNPRNQEAKSLYLNVLIELGFVGCASLFITGVSFGGLCKRALSHAEDRQEISIIVATQSALVAVSVAGLFDTCILEMSRLPGTLIIAILLANTYSIAKRTSRLAPPVAMTVS